MKRLLLFLSFIALLSSCSHGLNKPIIEPLTVDDLRSNMKDTTFTDFYSRIQKISAWILADDVKQAKYGKISYKQIKKYEDFGNDTTFFNKKNTIWKNEYDGKYPNYDRQVDSIAQYWKEYIQKYNMDSLVTIEFAELWKEYYSYSHDVRDVNVGFRITPLKGKIDQLVFRYEMVTKVNNTGKISYLNSHRCVATSPISKTDVVYWEADYSDEKLLKSRSTQEVKRDYDFNIELVNVRINGENYEDRLNAVPYDVKHYLEYSNETDFFFMADYYKDKIITSLIDPAHIGYSDYQMEQIKSEMKKFDPEVYALFAAYEEDDK